MNKELSPEELEQLKSFEDRYNSISYELGLIQLEKYEMKLHLASIEEFEQNLIQSYSKYLTEMQEFSINLESKYGSGAINMESGNISAENHV